MRGPYGFEMNEGCESCGLRAASFFCQLTPHPCQLAFIRRDDFLRLGGLQNRARLVPGVEGDERRSHFRILESRR